MDTGWLQITVTTARAARAEAVFEDHGAQAVTLLDAGNDLTVEQVPHAHPDFDTARVVGLFAREFDPAPLAQSLRDALGDDIVVETQILHNRDWSTAWLARHPPLCFGDRLWIAPHGAAVETGADAVVVRLDPGLAFGTGTHPTTALCLEWLATHDLRGKRVLDYGCGSGILAVAAARLGAAAVTAVDVDKQAVRATRDNSDDNAVGARVATPAIDAIEAPPFDIVLANILAKPLVALAPTLTAHADPGAALVLSGLLTRQVDEVRRAYEPAFLFAEGATQAEWARLDAQRVNA